MAKYTVDQNYLYRFPKSTASVKGSRVVCLGTEKQTVEVPATKDHPAYKREIPAATQDDLKWLHENGAYYVLLEDAATAAKN